MKVDSAAEYICNYPDLYVDNLKLQKLLFYSQAVSLVLRNARSETLRGMSFPLSWKMTRL